MEKQIVVVLGMHRSGTSLITKGLESLGVELSESMIPQANDNVKGFWEDADILDFNERLLNTFGSYWYTTRPFKISDINSNQLNDLISEAYELISLKLEKHDVWGFKDPRTCVLLDFWNLVFQKLSSVEVKYLVCLRNPVEVAGSLQKRDAILEHHAYYLWLYYVTRSLSCLNSGAKSYIVDYNEIISDPVSTLVNIASNLSLDIDKPKFDYFCQEYLDISLRHNVFDECNDLSPVSQFIYDFYNDLRADASLVDAVSIIEKYNLEFSVYLEKEIDYFHKEQLLISSKLIRNQKNKLDRDEYDFRKEIDRLTTENQAILDDLNSVLNSFSWKVTRPIRLLSTPKAYLPALKLKLKESPFEPVLRKFYYGYLNSKRFIATIPYSGQNLSAIQSMSLKRADILCSEQHVRSITHKTPHEALPEIDLTIVTYNNGQWLDKFLGSLLSQNYPVHKLNLHFVDNGSTNNTFEQLLDAKEKLGGQFAGFSVYQRENLGFGAGHDYAVSQSTNELFLVTNIDLEFAPESIETVVVNALSDDEKIASWELKQLPYEHPKYYDPVTFETNWSSHACILIRRSAYVEVGGYEERIFMYGEDVELSYRFRSYGYSLKYVPSAFVYHYTYDEVNQVKPIQFSGSTLANAYLRLRYGNTIDKLVGLALQFALLVRGGGFEGSRKLVLNNLKLIFKNASYFVSTANKNSRVNFPFRYFDYELIRDGAFYEVSTPINTHEQPLVTIITRTYQGREFWLKECMASVINQTYSNIQHIIVEDGGDTHSSLVSKAKQSYSSDYNVEFYGFEKKGRSYTGNQGLARAQGQYCLFLDDDDLIFPDHVEVLVNELISTPDASAVYSLAWDVHTKVDKEAQRYKESVFETLPLFYQEFDYLTLLDHNYIPIQSILFERALYEQHGGFEEDMDQLEDWNLWTRYASGTQFKFVEKTTSLFRTPADQAERLRRASALNEAFSDAVKRQS
ncbi:glycosyltransferase [Vibrio sp. TRT 1302]|uniref:glycosyltransferase n=1 Tax=Vibrio sp. TRT 1302 TaxID=3418504 RepID=UPI003CFA7F33